MGNFESIKMLRASEVSRRLGIHRTSVTRKVKGGEFTPAIRVNRRCSLWPEHEVETILAAHIAGADKDEIKELVKRLREARARHYEALKRLTKTDEQPENETE